MAAPYKCNHGTPITEFCWACAEILNLGEEELDARAARREAAAEALAESADVVVHQANRYNGQYEVPTVAMGKLHTALLRWRETR